MMKLLTSATTMDRQSTCRPLPLKTIARRVPWILRQYQRICAVRTQAQPMIVMQQIPSEIGPERTREGKAKRLAVGGEIGDLPPIEKPGGDDKGHRRNRVKEA